MEKWDGIASFDRCAPAWEAEMGRNDEIIEKILDNAEVGEGCDVLDVACGAGGLFPYYLRRGAASVTGVDLSAEMVKMAAEKFEGEPAVRVICGDVEALTFDRKFDRIVVYNAFPRFAYPKRLLKTLAGLLKEDGRLTIAHSASWETDDRSADGDSNALMPAGELMKLFDPHFTVEVMISNRQMYQLSGVKRDPLAHSHCGVTHTHGGVTHTHSHGDEAHEHVPEENATPIQELLVLMKYLVSHNDAHAQEVADLAAQLHSAGKYVAYDEIMDAVSDFDMVNAKLDAILSQLMVEEF